MDQRVQAGDFVGVTLGFRCSGRAARLVESGAFWKRHVDHLRPAANSPNAQIPHTVPVLPNLAEPTDYAPIGDTEFNAEQLCNRTY